MPGAASYLYAMFAESHHSGWNFFDYNQLFEKFKYNYNRAVQQQTELRVSFA